MASLSFILENVQRALTVTGTGLFQPSNCFFAFYPLDSLARPPADQFCVIQPHSVDVKDRAWAGTNKNAYLWRMAFTVWVFVRLGTDEAHRDDLYLLDPTYGNVVLTDKVINILQDYVMIDDQTGNVFGFQLQEVAWQIEDRDEKGWGFSTLSYETDINARSQV